MYAYFDATGRYATEKVLPIIPDATAKSKELLIGIGAYY
jgi:hypothetical protein